MRPVLVTGATGTVGREAVRSLIARGHTRVRSLVRDPSRAVFPAGVEVVQGDLRDRAAVDRALDGVSAAFYVSPHEPDEEALARSFVAACEAHGARVVFVGVHADGPNRLVRALKRGVYAVLFRHYRAKFRLSERVRQEAARAVILMPTNFFQNDELAEGTILGGTYPMPLGTKGVNRVDVRDLGDAIARALTDGSVAPGAYPVVGPASLTAHDCAATWGRALGRPVACDGDLAAFEAIAARSLRGKKLTDFVASHRLISGVEIPTLAEDVARTTAFLGRPPRTYEEWVRDRTAIALAA